MVRRGSLEIRAIDQCVDAYSNLALLPNTPTAQLWAAAVILLEAIEVYKATPRGHKQSRVDAVEVLRKQTQAVLTKLRWQEIKDVSGNKPGLKPMVEHVWSEMHSPGQARVGHGEYFLDPNPWLDGKPGTPQKYLFQYLRKVRAETPKPDNVLYIASGGNPSGSGGPNVLHGRCDLRIGFQFLADAAQFNEAQCGHRGNHGRKHDEHDSVHRARAPLFL